MTQAIIYTGGISHPFERSSEALCALLADVQFVPRVSFELDDVIAHLKRDPGALLVVNALRWSMTQNPKYDVDRPRWGLTTTPEQRAAITKHVADGAGLLALHTACICFDDWPGWLRLLGGGWVWGRSHHPPLGPVRASFERGHFLNEGLADFAVTDEAYSELALDADALVAGHVRAPGGAPQPALWTHVYGAGRVAFDSLGHDAESIEQTVHRHWLQRAALWASGLPIIEGEDGRCVK